VDVVEVARAVVAEAAPLAKDRPYRVRLLAHDAPRVRTDGTKVKQILTNLVSNAVKFTHQGQVDVSVSAVPGGGCTIAVRDTGIGIKPEHMQVIFEEFRQLDGSYTRQFGGSGLGLAIARRFAEMLGGDLSVESTEGVGSTFTLRLPPAVVDEPGRTRRRTRPPVEGTRPS
jgi:signal transduction histidine kinase